MFAVRLEHQSKYFSQVGYTLYLICAYFWIDDVRHLSDKEKIELKAECDKSGIPHIYRETHVFVSDDMTHDVAAVIHFNMLFLQYVQKNVQYDDRPFNIHYGQSDGCAAQFANATFWLWISKSHKTGITVDWCYFCSCHGKCDCDPEGGSGKRLVDCEQLRDSSDNSCKITCVDPELVHFLRTNFIKPQKSATRKHGKGVYQRVIHYVPARGKGKVNRRIQHADTFKGSKKIRQVTNIGAAGKVRLRKKACHQCKECMQLRPSQCVHMEACGRPFEATISEREVPVPGWSMFGSRFRRHMTSLQVSSLL